MEGWIKLHKKIMNWEWYKDNNVKGLFLHLLLNANYEEKRWQGIVIKRGQLVTSLKHLSEQTGMSVQQIRTAITKLEKTQNLTSKSTNKFTLITIENYELYQSYDNFATSKSTNEQQTNNNNIRIIKNKKKNIYPINDFTENQLENLYEN